MQSGASEQGREDKDVGVALVVQARLIRSDERHVERMEMMDIRTGQTYDTLEAALAAGVPESDIAYVTVKDGEYWVKFTNPKYPQPHGGERERARRARQLAKAGR